MTISNSSLSTAPPLLSNTDGLQARIALRITSVLSEGSRNLPHDVTERLRFARETALARSRAVSAAANRTTGALQQQSDGTLTLGGTGGRGRPQRGGWFGDWGLRLVSVLPLAALLAGLVLIQDLHIDSQISAAAEVDSELLADELPPTAYSDPGFVEFLKTPAE